jgi:fibronectin type 3 domain-containing protein
MEIASEPSPPATTAYPDVFAPPMPVGLVSAADTTAKAIDLNWTPDVDPGLAGYIVYRRAVGTNEAPERISPAGKPVTISEWSDTTAVPGQRYAYSVSAIDVSGNESKRSTEVEDGWSAPPAQPASPTSPQPNPQR